MPRRAVSIVLAALVASIAAAQASFQNFETALVHPMRVSADGSLLFVANAPDNRLEVYSLADPANPLLLRVIPVGLEPVLGRAADERRGLGRQQPLGLGEHRLGLRRPRRRDAAGEGRAARRRVRRNAARARS